VKNPWDNPIDTPEADEVRVPFSLDEPCFCTVACVGGPNDEQQMFKLWQNRPISWQNLLQIIA